MRQGCSSRWSSAAFAVAVLSVLSIASVNSAFAQSGASPVAGTVVLGKDCTVPARDYTFLGDLLATPIAKEQYVSPTAVPKGNPVDSATAREIETAVHEFIACSNSGEVLRALSLLDDEYLRRLFDPTGVLDIDTANQLLETLATPIAIPEDEQVILLRIVKMVALKDGQYAVVLETDGGLPNEEGTDTDLFIFEKINDQWLVMDAINDIDDIEAGRTPTPESGS